MLHTNIYIYIYQPIEYWSTRLPDLRSPISDLPSPTTDLWAPISDHQSGGRPIACALTRYVFRWINNWHTDHNNLESLPIAPHLMSKYQVFWRWVNDCKSYPVPATKARLVLFSIYSFILCLLRIVQCWTHLEDVPPVEHHSIELVK